MVGAIGRLDTQRALSLFGDWTDRIKAGELPFAKPPRPQGQERNIVVTLWDWNSPTAYLHDEIATDKRNPRVNAGGLLYGSPEESTDNIPVLDPVRNSATTMIRYSTSPAANTEASSGNRSSRSSPWLI